MTALLVAKDITKSFGANAVFKGVNLAVAAGQVVAIVGENGAGKSTLMKILSGVYPTGDYGGQLYWAGAPVGFTDPGAAQRHGVGLIHQEIQLVPELSVAANIFLGRERAFAAETRLENMGFIAQERLNEAARHLLTGLGVAIDPGVRVGDLSLSQQQLVEIAKALSAKPKLLIFDEPTSSLTDGEIEHLFRVIADLKANGTAVLYISHKMDEIQRLADAIVVLRDGVTVAAGPIGEFTPDSIIQAMVGRAIEQLFPPALGKPGDEWLVIDDLCVTPSVRGRRPLKGVSLTVRRGEILGLAGLVGSGRSELLEHLFGALPGTSSGVVRLSGRPFRPDSPAAAMAQGVALVTEDRKGNGLVLGRSVSDNLTLANLPAYDRGGWVDRLRERLRVDELVAELAIRTASADLPVGSLSGGNQQKVVLGKWLDRKPQLLLLDEPTRGVDVGAKAEIYALVRRLADEGMAIIMASSELPEVLGLSDRVAVMADGTLRGILPRAEATDTAIMRLATGGNG